jgi:putative DNA primase/helicase
MNRAISLNQIHHALGGEISGGQVLCPGPGHSQQDRSLAVKPADNDDGFVVMSFAGDDWRLAKDHVRQKLGMPRFQSESGKNSNDFNSSSPDIRRSHSRPQRTIAKVYDYTDEAGCILFQAIRYEPKGFAQRRPNGNGGFTYSLDGVRRVPYRLPELIEAVANGNPVFVVEGEKDVEALRGLNIPATCNPMGASKWRDEYSEHFKDAAVYIFPDNDDAGRAHAQEVFWSLDGAKSVRIVEVPNLPDRGDVSDWLKAGGTAEQLYKLAGIGIEIVAPPMSYLELTTEQLEELCKAFRTDPAAIQSDEPTLESRPASSFQMTAVEWLWPNRFAIGKLGLIAGLPDEGKGQILSDIVARITSKDDKLWPCNEGIAPDGRVLFLSAEDDINDTIVPRLVAAGAALDQVEIIQTVHEAKRKDRMFSLVTDLDLLRNKVTQIGNTRLIVIDPISAYLGHGKIDSFRTTDVRAVLSPLVTLAAELKIAIIAIMHFNKKVDVTNALLRISDSLAFGAQARHVYGVVSDADNERKLFIRAKNNLASKSNDKALAYRFGARMVGHDPNNGKEIWAPHIIWEKDYVEVTATEAMQAAAQHKSPGAFDSAKNLLIELLGEGPTDRKTIDEAADANGVSDATLKRAKTSLGIEVSKERSKTGRWFWRLPDKGHPWPWEREG